MHDNSQWAQYHDSIKVEPLPENCSLLSLPLSPALTRRRSSHPGASPSPKRARPYPPRERIDDIHDMTTVPAYWSRPTSSRPNNDRRASDGQHMIMYATNPNAPYASMPGHPSHMYPQHQPDSGGEQLHRSPSSGSSGTSSLTGAMGDMSTVQPVWQPGTQQAPMMVSSPYATAGMPGYLNPHGPSAFPGNAHGEQYRNSPPESLSPHSPFTTPIFNDPFNPGSTYNVSPNANPSSASDSEIRRLRRKLHEAEQNYERAMAQVRALESRPAPSASASPLSLSTPPPTPTFLASWKARTEARVRHFCALNRAGNALCAWHDSRRERRAYPPRMAPPGVLNCGCTHAEALFEESLARARVGSYLPGESVRMDPALRNPLLKLLERRYGYRDGDFERDPRTGGWMEGEGPAVWEQLQRGSGRR